MELSSEWAPTSGGVCQKRAFSSATNFLGRILQNIPRRRGHFGLTCRSTGMQTPLSPLDFARRARRLYGNCEAVVDLSQRFTYEAFFDRCDRWSAALQSFGIR